MTARQNFSVRPRQRGLTLVELMISLVLGLIVTGGAISMFIANREVNRATENLSRMQENSRIAFELMVRSLREAGGTPCGSVKVANVLNNASTAWWANWDANTIHGYDNSTESPAVTIGTEEGKRVTGTDTVILMFGSAADVTIVKQNKVAASIFVNTTYHGINDDDIVMACDDKQAAIFQVTSASASNVTIVHNTGHSTPGNCSKGLGYPTLCTTTGNEHTFEDNGYLVKLISETWFIGNNSRGGRSLFRAFGTADPVELVENVTDMQLLYKTRDPKNSSGTNDYVNAGEIIDWTDVVAVNVELTFVSNDRISTASGHPQLKRKLLQVTTLRNRAP